MDRNDQDAALRFVADQHRQIQGSDLAWFNHMWKTLVHFDEPHGSTRPVAAHLPGITEPSQTHKSGAFLAVEFNKAGPMLKAYYMPGFKSAAVGHSTMAVINNSIAGLPSLPLGVRNGHKRLIDFLDLTHQGRSLTQEIVATDCIALAKSRIKIYMRSQSTSLESGIETLCLGDAATRERRQPASWELKRLWGLVFGLPSGGDNQAQLPRVSHRTGGMLYYFSLGGSKSDLTVKVYLPVRHYAMGDREATSGLMEYIRTTSRSDYSGNCTTAPEEIMSHSIRKEQKGVQTYLSVALEIEGLSITSYLSPAVYLPTPQE